MNFRVNILVTCLLLVAALFAQTGDSLATTPYTGEQEPINMGWLLFKTMGILVLIIALIFILVILLKKYVFGQSFPGKDSEWIQVLGQIQIQPKKFLALVKVMDRVILVGLTDSSIESLAEFTDLGKIQPYLEQMGRHSGNWNEAKFLGLFKKKLES